MDKKYTMLLVNDSKICHNTLNKIFKDNFNIYEAENGEDALSILNNKHNEIDIILLDIVMTKNSRYDFLRIKSEKKNLSNIPVVVITAYDNPELEIKALELGAVDFVTTPLNSKIVRSRILNVINNSKCEMTEYENIKLKRQRINQERLQMILDNIPGGVALTEIHADGTKINLYESKGFEKLSDCIIKNKTGSFNFVHEADRKRVKKASRDALSTNTNFDIDFQVYNKSDEIRWINMKLSKIVYADNNTVLLTVTNDVTSSKSIEAELRNRAEYDKLTGIFNQETFYSKTSNMIRSNPTTQFVIIYWNIERFKVINDLFGTLIGNKMLCEMAKQLKKIAGNIGTYGRIFADHFVICIDKKFLNIKALCKKSEHFFDSINLNFTTTTCFGIYDVEDPNIPVDHMCDRANLALQKVKGNYSVHYAYYDKTLRDTLIAEQEIYNDMTVALNEHQFEIYVQPIVDVRNNRVDSGEILIRWNHPEKGLIPPGDFVPLFEKNGFIRELDYFVWEEACRFLSDRKKKNLREIPVSVNISRINVQNPNLCNLIIGLTKKYKIDPAMLKLEITESAYIDNPQKLLEKTSYLQSLGFIVAMDDFGSGFSSLNLLKDFPVDILKIDMRFLGNDTISSRSGIILTSVVNMAKELNILTVAEGVETKAHVAFLDSIGCNRLQGYYFSRPVTTDDFNEISEQKINYNSNHYNLIKNTLDFDFLKFKNHTPYLLFGNIPYGVSIYSVSEDEFKLVYANDSYLSMMGYSVYENPETKEISYSVSESEQLNKLKESCLLVADDKNDRTITLERKSRISKKLISTKISYFDGNSEDTLISVNSKDITEETEVKSKLNSLNIEVNKSKGNIVNTFDSLPCAIIILGTNDDSPKIIYHNDYASRILGYTNDEFASEVVNNPNSIIYDDDKTYAELLVEYYVQIQDYTTYELRMKKRDGTVIWVIGKTNLVTIDGESYVQNTFIELTDKLADKHTTYSSDERIESYHQKLNPLYKNIPCAVLHYTVEDEPVVIDFNDKYSEVFMDLKSESDIDKALDKYIGNSLRDLIPGDIYDFDERFMKYRKEHCYAVDEPITINTISGQTVHALLSCNIIDLPDGTKVYQDIYKLISKE